MTDSQKPTGPPSGDSAEGSALKGLGRKILRLFIQDGPSGDAPTTGVPATNAPRPGSTPTAGSPVTGTPSVGPASVGPAAANRSTTTPVGTPSVGPASGGPTDAKFAEHLALVLEKANIAGPDYFEFREILKNLAHLGLSEEKQFGAAWASFRAMAGPAPNGAAALTSTARQYLTLLQADRDAFQKTADNAVAEKVGTLQQEKSRLQAENDTLTKQVQELQNRLKANTERLNGIGGEIDEQSGRIQQNKQAYEATYAAFTDQIKTDIARIETYLLTQSPTN